MEKVKCILQIHLNFSISSCHNTSWKTKHKDLQRYMLGNPYLHHLFNNTNHTSKIYFTMDISLSYFCIYAHDKLSPFTCLQVLVIHEFSMTLRFEGVTCLYAIMEPDIPFW